MTRGVKGRGFSTATPLGKRMEVLGYSVNDVAAGAGVHRQNLNDYLNHGVPITTTHMMRLCAFLKCEPEMLKTD